MHWRYAQASASSTFLRLGGRVLILDTDLDSIVWHATDTEQMGRLLAAWIERFADPYLPRTQDLPRLGEEARYFFSLNRYLFLAHR